MSKEKHYPPQFAKGKFHCPQCQVFAKQRWSHLHAVGDYHSNVRNRSRIHGLSDFSNPLSEDWVISKCEHCNQLAIWLNEEMIFPESTPVPEPNEDLGGDIISDYNEAAAVLNDSPRSAAAILRLALEKLCERLGAEGGDLNDQIGSLVEEGLSPKVQKSLDSLRITGNNAVHPARLDLKDDVETVSKLFELINIIAREMITEPKEVNSFYDNLPEEDREGVENRDNNAE